MSKSPGAECAWYDTTTVAGLQAYDRASDRASAMEHAATAYVCFRCCRITEAGGDCECGGFRVQVLASHAWSVYGNCSVNQGGNRGAQ